MRPFLPPIPVFLSFRECQFVVYIMNVREKSVTDSKFHINTIFVQMKSALTFHDTFTAFSWR